MDQGQGRSAARILEIQVIVADLIGKQQALVDNGAARHAGYVILLAVREPKSLNRTRGSLAYDVKLALQRILHNHIGATSDKDLPHHGFFIAHTG